MPRGSQTTTQAGARESSAGDDFHLLWAMRRAVDLLYPQSGLELLTLEGLPPEELAASDDNLLQGIDLAEYYGGSTWKTADRVVVTQVKYSSRNPDEPWTYGTLAKSRKTSPNTSPIRRMAQAFQAFSAHHSAEEVEARLKFCLVSNQPVAEALIELVDEAKELVVAGSFGATSAEVVAAFPHAMRAAAKRLVEQAGLETPCDAVRLLSLLDLSQCGQGNRHVQKLLMRQELGVFVGPHARQGSYTLHEELYEEVMPDRATSSGVNREFVLAALEATTAQVFPVPAELGEIDRPVPTSGPQLIANAIAAGHRRIVAHGAGGIGKTTALTKLEPELPDGSEVIVYDCFGSGRYKDATGEERHSVRRAVRQLFNEVSARFSLPMYVGPDMSDDDMWLQLRRTVENAAASLPSDAVLVLAVDAADNSIVGAKDHPEGSFAPGLWGLSVPDNVVLLMSARSHRRVGLGEPADVHAVELEPFTPEQSALMLARVHAGAPTEIAATFHDRTGGNPRLQQYLLDANKTLTELEQTITKDWTLPELFEGFWADAVVLVPSEEQARRDLARLVFMARPQTVTEFARVSGQPPVKARAIVSALEPGLQVSGDSIGFQDEPFETFLREKFDEAEEAAAHEELLDYYWPRRHDDPIAARSIAQHLQSCGRTDELLTLALDEGKPDAISDDVQRLHVYRQRLTRAMSIADSDTNPVAAAKLVYLAAEAAQTDGAVTSLVQEAPALFKLFGDPDSVTRVLHADDSATWAGPAYMQAAAVAGRLGDLTTAAEQWGMAQAWLRRWSTRTKDDGPEWRLEATDIAIAAEAVFWLHDLRTAVRWLSRWGPEAVRWEAISQFAKRIAPYLADVPIHSNTSNDAVVVAAMLVAARWRSGLESNPATIAAVATRLEQRLRAGRIVPEHESWGVDFCEALARVPRQRTRCRYLASKLGPGIPNYGWPRWPSDDWPVTLRRWCLRAALAGKELTPDEIMPRRIRWPDRKTRKHEAEREREKFRAAISAMLPLYAGRASVIAGTRPRTLVSDLLTEFDERTNQLGKPYVQPDPHYRSWVGLLIDTLARVNTRHSAEAVRRIVPVSAGALDDGGPWMYLTLGARVKHDPRFRGDVLQWAHSAVEQVAAIDQPARERWGLLLGAAKLVVDHDLERSRDYFEQAVAAAEGLDDDAAFLLESYARCATTVDVNAVDAAARDRVAGKIAAAMESVERYVANSDYVPTRQVAEAIAHLNWQHALALASRWDDEQRLTLGQSIPSMASKLVTQGALPVQAHLRLRTMAGDWNHTEAILEEIDAGEAVQVGSASQRALEKLVRWILTDLALDQRLPAARDLRRWAQENGLAAHEMLEPITELIAFHEAQKTDIDEPDRFYVSDDRDVLAPFPTTVDDVEDAVTGVLAGTASRDVTRDWFVEGARTATVAVVLRVLETLAKWDYHADPYSAMSAVRALTTITDVRRDSARVRTWVAKELPALTERLAPALASLGRSAPEYLSELIDLTPKAALTPMLRACALHMDTLDARGIQALAQIIIGSMDGDEACDVIEWGVDRLRGEQHAATVTAMESRAAWVKFAFAQFGNAERAIRWRAAHFARDLLLADAGFVNDFVSELEAPSVDEFNGSGLDPYIVSAKLQALVVLERVAGPLAAELLPHAQTFERIATDTAFPHVVMRDLAGRICQTLGIDLGGPVNEPTSCFVAGRPWDVQQPLNGDEDTDTRYHFDSIDTIPYWFDPLGKVFAITGKDVARIADDWLRDAFDVTERPVDPRRAVWGSETWSRNTYTDHGKIPTHEGLNPYLAYHSMCLAAGQLIDSGRPIIVERDDYGWAEDQWKDWLAYHVPTSGDWWVADLRGPAPVDRFTQAVFPAVGNWRSEDDEQYNEALLPASGGIIVSSFERAWRGQLDGERLVTSAIAPSDVAESLLAALESLGPDEYWLPRDNRHDHGNSEIDHGDYQLRAWLRTTEHSREGIDRLDPFGRISPDLEVPMPQWLSHLGAEPVAPLCWKSIDGTPVVKVRVWSDQEPDDDYHRSPGSSGARTTVAVRPLTRALRATGNDLVISIRMKKHIRTSGSSESDYDHRGVHRVYRLAADGSLTYMERDPDAGKTDRSVAPKRRTRQRAR